MGKKLFSAIFPVLGLFLPLLASPAWATTDTYWDDRARGWFWYEDPAFEAKPKEEKAKPEPLAEKKKPKRIEDMLNAEEVRAEVKRLLDIASGNPTRENVKAYMDANKYTLDTAGKFTEVWASILREEPALDNTLKAPVNALAASTKQKSDLRIRAKKVADTAKSNGIFFFFRGDCEFCHAFAPTVVYFAKMFDMEVFPVSLDGGTLPEYPRPEMDNGISTKLNITTVPAIFLGNKVTGGITAIGYGVMSVQEMVDRIYTVITSAAKE